jgi:hypothetical protein
MKKSPVLCLLGLSLVCQGCSTFAATARTLAVQPLHFCDQFDRLKTHRLHRRLALEALEAYTVMHPDEKCTHDFTQGFVAGYTRILDKGGTSDAPSVPPRQYWRVKYRTPAGRPAVEAWFAGYRAGAGAALASGYRNVDTIATSLPPRSSAGFASYETDPPDAPTLPEPRPVEPTP